MKGRSEVLFLWECFTYGLVSWTEHAVMLCYLYAIKAYSISWLNYLGKQKAWKLCHEHPTNRSKMAQGESSIRVYSGYLDSYKWDVCIFFCGTKATCLHLTNYRGNLCFHFESIGSWKESLVRVIIPNFRRVACRNSRANIRINHFRHIVKKEGVSLWMCAKLNFGNTYQIILVSKKEAEVLKKVVILQGSQMDSHWKSTLYIIKRGQINWEKWDGVKELGKNGIWESQVRNKQRFIKPNCF